MKILLNLVASSVLFISFSAYALDCNNANTQMEMNQCSYLDYQKTDKELNKLYNQYRATLPPERKEQLKKAQLAWVKFRDLDCQYEMDFYKGGSIVPLIRNGCYTVKTKQRIKDVKQLFELSNL